MKDKKTTKVLPPQSPELPPAPYVPPPTAQQLFDRFLIEKNIHLTVSAPTIAKDTEGTIHIRPGTTLIAKFRQ